MTARVARLRHINAVLTGIRRAVLRARAPAQLLDAVCRVIVERGGFAMAWVGLVDPSTGRFTVAAHAGDDDGYVARITELFSAPLPEGHPSPAATAMRERRNVVIADVATDPRMEPWRGDATRRGYRSAAAFALVVDDRPYGALNVYASEPGAFDDDEVALFDEVSADIAYAVEFAKTEAALRESRDRLARAVAAGNVGLWDWDLDTDRVYFSPEWKRQIGFGPDEPLGSLSDWRERLHPADRDRAVSTVREYLRAPDGDYECEFRFRHRDGTYRTILAHGSVARDAAGRPVRLMGAHVDITERAELEAQLHQSQRIETIGRLAGGVAHDFNNLLTVILGHAEFALADLRVDEPLYEDLRDIQLAAERAASLTRQLLAFSRRQSMQAQPVQLASLVVEMERMLRRLIGEDVSLTLDVPRWVSPVWADPGQVEQVVMNLVVNARDAMPAGGDLAISLAEVRLDAPAEMELATAPPGDYVVLSVRDTGLGIDEATRRKMFEPFFTTKELGRGTGLGLSTVYGILRQSGGYVSVESAPSRGSTFRAWLPATAARAQADGASPTGDVTRGSETVLLVEDDGPIRALAARVLSAAGYCVLSAGDARAAQEVAARHAGHVHLLLTDLVLPGLSGRELAERVRAAAPGARVLFMSGYTDDVAAVRGARDASLPLLLKPFTPSMLLARVRATLDGDA